MSLRDHVSRLPHECQVVAFYSYKGGVGRTMALCNVAAQIARRHSQRGADARDKAAEQPRQPLRILCVDLDLEAPGIPAYLPPARGTKVKGFLGLLNEYFLSKPTWEGEALKREFRRALGEQLADYAYAVPDTDNLFVLPTGSLTSEETVRIRRRLYDLLEPVREAESQAKAQDIVPFFPEFKAVLREYFDYAFVDSRTGLSDMAYATTTVLADGMVFLFRPNLTQLIGIQDVFGRFLVERPYLSLEGDPRRIPVIPVLSPRPNYSTPHLNEVRKAAAARIFRWLDSEFTRHSKAPVDRYAPAPPKLQELPFDSSVEVGERLMISPNPKVDVEDKEAPLYKAYVELAEEIQKRNTERDILGPESLEMEHYRAGRKDEAFNCLLAGIALRPDNIRLWGNIWEGYSDHLGTSAAARNQLVLFCEEARKLPEDHPVPRFFGALWLSEVCEATAPGICPGLIAELWAAARHAMDATMLRYGITRIKKHYAKHGSGVHLVGCPSWSQANGSWLLDCMHAEIGVTELLNILVGAETFFLTEPETGRQGLELLGDQLGLVDNATTRAAILRDIARAHILQGDLLSSYRAYAAAVALPECPETIERSFVFLQMRVLPRQVVEDNIREVLPQLLQPAMLMLLEIREASNVDTVRARLEALKKVDPAVAEDPNFEYYALMHHRQFREAWMFMGERLGKVKGGVGVGDLTKLRLAQWLSGGAALDDQMTAYAGAQIASPELVIDQPSFDICLALAACPQELGREAVRRLSRPQWPIVRFGWMLLACLTDEDYDVHRAELEAMLNENPFLACLFRKQEDFPLLRFVLERHHALGAFDRDALRQRTKAIDLVESVKADFGSPPEPLTLPGRIDSKDDPRFSEVIERWKRNLAWLRDDKDMGPVVDKLIESHAKATSPVPG